MLKDDNSIGVDDKRKITIRSLPWVDDTFLNLRGMAYNVDVLE
jgi:hypothetical protein